MTDRRLPSSDVCKTLDISRSALTQWIEKGWITPAEQLSNGAYLFTEAEVTRAKAAQLLRSVS